MVHTCLRVTIAAMCVALACHALAYEDQIFSALYLDFGWSEESALAVDHAGAIGLLLCAALLWVPRAWPALLFVSAWTAALMITRAAGEEQQPLLVPFTHAVRYLAPLALALLIARRGDPHAESMALWILRVAAAATFLGHGARALLLHANYVDLILMAGRRMLGVEIAEDAAGSLLQLIGAVDVVLAVSILGARWRAVPAYMAIWGAVTVASRMVHSGLEAWTETVLRTPNWGVPLAILLAWLRCGSPGGEVEPLPR